jgi:hypothetical protein
VPLAVAASIILSGCAAAQFSVVGQDEYRIFKNSDLCAGGLPSTVLNEVRQEALKFCAGRKEMPVEISFSSEVGIPYFRCASAEVVFKCAPPPKNG